MTKQFSYTVRLDANGQTQVIALEQMKSANGRAQGQIQGDLTSVMQASDVTALGALLTSLQTLLEAQ